LEPKGTAEDYSVGDLMHMTAAGIVVEAAGVGVGIVVGDTPGEQLYYFLKGVACSPAAAEPAGSFHEARREGRPVRLDYRQAEDFE